MTSVLKVDNIQNSSGTSAKIDVHGFSVAVIADQKTQNTDGGTFTNGAWRTRDLNTKLFDPDGIVSISSNQFTLGSGTYLIEWSAPAFACGRNKTRLYDVTGNASVQAGSSQWTQTAGEGYSVSSGYYRAVLTANNVYKIEHRCEVTSNTYGLGVASNFDVEIYTQVKITKLA
mgnify:CR=1 FL=1